MQPTNFSANEPNPMYYSLNYPTLARHCPETFKGKTIITLLNEVERITRAYQEYVAQVIPNTESLCETAANNKFTFYHSGSDQETYPNILDTSSVMAADSRFTKNQNGKFAEHSQFFKGFIKIQHVK